MENISGLKIPFGLKNGKLVSVSEVDSGLACNSICPACKGILQAKKGYSGRVHHFSHDPSNKDECISGYETSIHLMAKQILEEEGKVNLPEYKVSVSDTDIDGNSHSESEILYIKGSLKMDSVVLEKNIDEIRPDIIGFFEGEQILIEIAVSHFVSLEKKDKIKKLGIQAVEIDLSKINPLITKEELREIIISEYKHKKWINQPEQEATEKMLRYRLKSKLETINSQIRQRRKQAKQQAAQKQVVITREKKPQKQTESGVYSSCWLRCDMCSHVWLYAPERIIVFRSEVTCPKCSETVSTKPAM
ncbi:hypothetical protein [Endozoicomonas lisbonensis]|uniref:Uncharacterized protein n=1 Tax=Endozoicomonas lisbonensis TaxID=3120522 RepID=A0ABV2SD10_9GAMM